MKHLRHLAFCCLLLLAALPLHAAPVVTVAAVTVAAEEVEAQFDLRCVVQRDESAAFAPATVRLGYDAAHPQNAHLALTLAAREMTLARVAGGGEKVLARTTKYYEAPSTSGTKLVLQWRDGVLAVVYGERVLLRQGNLGALEGAAALVASDGVTFADAQFQPVEPIYFADDFMRTENAAQWETARGEWTLSAAANPVRVANAFAYTGQGDPALTVAGRWFWNDYTAAAAVKPMGEGVVGLVVYWQDADNYLLFKWLSDGATGAAANGAWRGKEKQLWRVWNGRPEIIAAAPGGYRAKQWYRVSAGVDNGVLQAAIDDQIVLQKPTELFGQGRAGLFNQSATPAIFDDVVVFGHDNREAAEAIHKTTITPQFALEDSMSNWASAKSEWRPVEKDGIQTFWNRGTFFGDYAVTAEAAEMAPGAAKARLILGDGKAPNGGYALEATRPDDKHLKVVLLRNGQPVQETQAESGDTEYSLALRRDGNRIRGAVGEVEVEFTDAYPLAGRRAGFVAQNAKIDPESAHVASDHVYDYTFYRAPTDWIAGSGEWDIASRWLCSPEWSWYGGWSDRLATLWNKREFSGDYVVEAFAACKMDNAVAPFYNHPRDINLTVGGDGRDPASGYSFIFGGWNNTVTRIMRGTETVAETKDVLLPANYHDAAHHKWFALRVEKTGDTFSYFIDDKLVLRFRDPNPLPGRRVALWTAGNGVMIARATIYFEEEAGLQSVLPRVADEAPSAPIEKLFWQVRGDDKTVRLDAVNAASPAVRAVDEQGGGEFAVAPQVEAFDAIQSPKLSFSLRLTPGAAVNLYFKAKDTLHSLHLTGPQPEDERDGVKQVGAASVSDDGLWHDVNLDLAALLKPLYPDATELKIDEIFFGDLSRDEYHRFGFGANAPGSEYSVRSFALRSSDNRVAQIIEPQLRGAPPAKIAAAPVESAVGEPAAVEPASIEPTPATVAPPSRGLLNLRATFCQDEDGGALTDAMLNQPIAWTAFSKPIFTAPVETIDFTWPDKSPGSGIRSTYWSARFYGKIQVPIEGDYVFSLDRLDDGGRLFIDGREVLAAWKVQQPATHESAPLHLAPGTHEIRLDYCQGPGSGGVALSWKGPDFEKEIVPAVAPSSAVQQRVAAQAR